MKKINTIVVTHNNYQGLKTTLESIRRNTPPNFNIILVDQNPVYQKVDELVDLHIFTGGKNIGFSKGMNTGFRLADTEYVTAWNDDCECINKKWWDGIMETFDRYDTALGVNPSSPRNPKASGEEPVSDWAYQPDYPDEQYAKLLKEHGKGVIIDGICTWATVFRKDRLDKLLGVIPGKCWFDEYFWPGGGEDYDLNRRAYMTKNSENKHGGYRMLGTGLSYTWHWWYKTRRQSDGKEAVKHCGTAWHDKWGIDADLFGRQGKQAVPMNIIKDLDTCFLTKYYGSNSNPGRTGAIQTPRV